MIMEAIPFVLVGVLVSGLIQSFISEQWIAKVMPRNRVLSSLLGCSVGVLFPSCECGIVPITRRLLNKGVPLHAGIAFMLTGPIVNPIVMFSTFIAFGNDWTMALIRAGMAFAVALAVSLTVSFLFPTLPLRSPNPQPRATATEIAATAETARATIAKPAWYVRVYHVLQHAVDEFFSVGKYVVFGAFLAAGVQTFVPTATLLHLGSNPVTASLIMMALAFLVSLCSEADAFIASSFRTTFSTGSLSAFLVFGPMVDIKQALMMFGAFRAKFVVVLISLIVGFTLIGSLIVGRIWG